jgi:hypothetical protein
MLQPAQPETIPAGFHFLMKSKAGISWFMRHNDDGSRDFAAYADVEPLLDRNVAMQNHNDGWSVDGRGKADKLLRRVASVPWIVRYKWKQDFGVDYNNPDHQQAVDRLLDSSDWSKLRTANFRIGKQSQWF